MDSDELLELFDAPLCVLVFVFCATAGNANSMLAAAMASNVCFMTFLWGVVMDGVIAARKERSVAPYVP